MDKADLDKQREVVAAKIEKAFPKERQTKGKAKLTRGGYPYESSILKEALEGKSWQEVVNHAQIVYYLSEVDFMAALSERAYDYYFPAFLITSLNEPKAWVYYSIVLDYIERLGERSKVILLEALAAWLEFQLEHLRQARLRLSRELVTGNLPEDKQASSTEATLQKIRQLIDEKHSSS